MYMSKICIQKKGLAYHILVGKTRTRSLGMRNNSSLGKPTFQMPSIQQIHLHPPDISDFDIVPSYPSWRSARSPPKHNGIVPSKKGAMETQRCSGKKGSLARYAPSGCPLALTQEGTHQVKPPDKIQGK